MSRKNLSVLKFITMWAGVGVTLCGITYNVMRGGDIVGAYISLFGVFITSVSHIIGLAIARHDKDKKEEYEDRIRTAEEFMEEFGDIADKAPSLRRIIAEQDSRYEIEHQDDGR